MKKYILAALLCLFSIPFAAHAQTGGPQITAQLTASGATTAVGIAVTNIGYHQIQWVLSGPAPSACTITVDSSPDNITYTTGGAIPAQGCTAGGISQQTSFTANYIRINLSTFTGGGQIKISYSGWNGTGGGNPTLQTNGTNNSTAGLNCINSTGATGINCSNPSGNQLQLALANTVGGGANVQTCTWTNAVSGDVLTVNGSGNCVNGTLGLLPVFVTSTPVAIATTNRGNEYILQSGAVNLTIAQAGSAGFASNFYATIWNQSAAGAVTVTPTTSTIAGGSTNTAAGSTASVAVGDVCTLTSDNSNYYLSCAKAAASGSGLPYGTGAGSVNVMTVTTVPAVATNAAGTVVQVLPNLANTTTTPTLNVGGAGAQTVLKQGSSGALIAVSAADYSAAAANIIFTFVSNGTNWILLNPLTGQLGTQITIDSSGNLQCVASGSCNLGSNNRINVVQATQIEAFNSFSGNAVSDNGTFIGGLDTGSASTNVTGSGLFRGGDNTAASGTGAAGAAETRCGMTTSTSGFMGLCWFTIGAFKGATVTLWNVEIMTAATAATVTDSATTATSPACIAATTANPIHCIIEGLAPINADGASTVGHTICTSTTVGGQGHDSGGLAGCAVGTSLGVVYAITGTYNTPLGSTVTATSTLPIVRLKMD